jgi:Ca2+-binding RTX toxin-like protein
LIGGANDDVLEGGPGRDILDGGDGNDTATYLHSSAGVSVDLAVVTPQVSNGDAAGDILIGIENVTGSQYDDTLTGNDGANRLDGSVGADVMTGRSGDDVYVVDNFGDGAFEESNGGNDLIVTTLNFYIQPENVENLSYIGTASFTAQGNQLDNIITGGSLSDLLSGLDGNDTLIGAGGDDELHGGKGDDRLDGGTGHNVLDGGDGNDWLIVLKGSDTILIRPGFGNDVVDGFETHGLEGFDHIDVSAYGFGEASLGADLLILTLGDNTVISIGSDTLTLLHTKADAMDKGDFIFS